MKTFFIGFYGLALRGVASLQWFGFAAMRVAILIFFVWIGGLKVWNFEVEEIVLFDANRTATSFNAKDASEDTGFKMKEGEVDQTKQNCRQENRASLFSRGLGVLIASIGVLTFLGFFWTRIGALGELLAIIMTLGALSFLALTPEYWGSALRGSEYERLLCLGARRLVVQNAAIFSGAFLLLTRSAQKILVERADGVRKEEKLALREKKRAEKEAKNIAKNVAKNKSQTDD